MPETPTSAQVNAAMAAVTSALADNTISEQMEDALNDLWNVLQAIQNAIIGNTEQALVAALAAQNTQLQALNQKINDLSAGLDKASATIQSVSNTVGAIASIVGALV
jgi:archaellum component FlaC